MKHIYTLLVIALVLPLAVAAEFIPTLSAPLEIQVSPSAPTPGSTVTVSARSYSGNQNQITYTWSVNGRVVDQGLGRDTITVDVGVLGSETTILVSAVEGAADRGEASVTIRPADVDIVWEGDTSVPPYSGILPLPNGGSRVTFVAVPRVIGSDGIKAPEALMYTWKVNNGQAPALRGRGASVFTLSPPRFGNPFSVSVEVETPDGSAHARRSVGVDPAEAAVIIYEVAPLLGIRFDRAVQNSFTLFDEATFKAFPLYLARGDSTAAVAWTVNSAVTEGGGDNPREITLRKTGEGRGQYAIGFSYRSPVRMFESATKSFTLTF